MSSVILETNSLSRVVSDSNSQKKIVNDITCKFQSGAVYSVIGPSGAGKSSFLRLLNRLDEPTGGDVYLNNRSTRTMSPCDLRKRVGYLFQTPHLFDGSVGDNLLYANDRLTASQITSLLDTVHLDRKIINQSGATLSVGEKQRVALARLLATEPNVILLDEPTAALDPAATAAIERLIAELSQARNVTAIAVTHDPDQAMRLNGEVLLLVDGSLVESGSPEQVIHHPQTEVGQKFRDRQLI